jgi:hypothetical protein
VRPVPPWFRWLAYLMAAVFASFAALQYNDPDPVRWMAMYGAAVVISAALPSRRAAAAGIIAGIVVGLAAAAWAAVLVYSVWRVIGLSDLWLKMSEKGGAVEEGREAGGLAIEAAWLLAASAFRRRRA